MIPFFVLCLASRVAWIGVSQLFGRAEILVANRRIWARERVGRILCGWSEFLQFRMEVSVDPAENANAKWFTLVPSSFLVRLKTLRISQGGFSPLYAATGYPADILDPVRSHLAFWIDTTLEPYRRFPRRARRRPSRRARGRRAARRPVPSVGSDSGIHFIDEGPPPRSPAVSQGECQVCSTEMVEDLVRCASCKTTHHLACWVYNRRCSTYGCGSRRYRGSARVSTSPVRERAPSTPRSPDTNEHGMECQVCGHALTTNIVTCSRCRTPHHRECWTYVGQCTTFGCGGSSHSRLERPRRTSEVVIRGDRNRRPREINSESLQGWMQEIADEHGWGTVRYSAGRGRRTRLSFQHRGMLCTFKGRWRRGRFHVRLDVRLNNPGALALNHWTGSRSPAVLAEISGSRLRLVPRRSITGRGWLRRFISHALATVDEVASLG